MTKGGSNEDIEKTELTKCESPEKSPTENMETVQYGQSTTDLITQVFSFPEDKEDEKIVLPATNTLFNRKKNRKFATCKLLNNFNFTKTQSPSGESTIDKLDDLLNIRRKSSILEHLEMRSKIKEEDENDI